MQQIDPGRTAVYGASGTGKTTLVKQLVAKVPRAIIYDVKHEYSGFQMVTNMVDLMQAIKAKWASDFKIIYRPPIGTDREKELNDLSNRLFQLQAPYKDEDNPFWLPITLVVEEMSLCYRNVIRPADRDGFGELCSLGRASGIGVIGVTQRPAQVGGNFKGNLSATYAFRLEDVNDIDVLRKKHGSHVAMDNPGLVTFECQFLQAGNAERMKISP